MVNSGDRACIYCKHCKFLVVNLLDMETSIPICCRGENLIATEERSHGIVMSLLKRKCGIKGRYFKPAEDEDDWLDVKIPVGVKPNGELIF